MIKQNCGHFSPQTRLFLGFLSALVALIVASSIVKPAAAQDGASAIYLPAVGTGDTNDEPEDEPEDRPKPQPQPGSPESEFLIERARQMGNIDDETALLYRVYANFHDTRLPAEYWGDDSNAAPTLALTFAKARWDSLSAATQATLAPFLQAPTAPDSWLELEAAEAQSAGQKINATTQIVWQTACKTDTNIKVWYQQRYPQDADDAVAICELVSGTIWPRLKALFDRAPLDDVGRANNGGDGRLDLYLVNAKSAAIPYGSCFDSPSYLLINNQEWTPAEIVELVMSAFVTSYKAECLEYMWLFAASRTWAIDYVLPTDNHEQTYADDFLNHTELSLNNYPITPLEPENQTGDGAYLWLWYLTNFAGDAKTIMRTIWENATNADSLAVVDSAAGAGTFKNHWAKFSKKNWNNVPVATYFETDLLIHSTKPELETEVTLAGASDRSYELDGTVNYLAAHTYHFTFTDSLARSVLYINPFVEAGSPTAHVDAIYRLADGSWVEEDWTSIYSKEFCRDVKAERVVDLTIIISNHESKDRSHQLKPSYPPRLNVSNVACRGWVFEGTATKTVVSPFHNSSEKATVNTTFMREKLGDDTTSHPLNLYRATEGSGSWVHTGTSVDCVANGSGTFLLTGGLQTFMFVYNNATDRETGTRYVPGERAYVGFGSEGPENFGKLQVTYVCPNRPSSTSLVYSGQRWFETETIATQLVSEDGTTITGHYTAPHDGEDGTETIRSFEWTMKALPPE